MNRYRAGGPSKATPTTLCQKCLKKGHYTYECTATQQERPYISRPSRSQQLSNPKLAPKLSATLPPVDTKPAAKPESKLREKTLESTARSKPTERKADEPRSRRSRSMSSYSSDSVSSYSTNRSRSRSRSPARAPNSRRRTRDVSESRSPSPRAVKHRQPERRRSSSPKGPRNGSIRERASETGDRGTRTRSRSPVHRQRRGSDEHRRRSRSRSPYRAARDRMIRAGIDTNSTALGKQNRSSARERSLSPYSQRLALTKAANI